MNERYDACIQPAPEPASQEEEVTHRAPTDGATIIGNLGMASPARAAGSRSGGSSLRLGEPTTWRSATGDQTQKRWLSRMGQRTSAGATLKRRWSLESLVHRKGACQVGVPTFFPPKIPAKAPARSRTGLNEAGSPVA